MTEKLYYIDPYMSSFTARVLSCTQSKKGWEIVLDRSAFYPEGGGQPGDSGYIGNVRVEDTHEKNGEIVHYCAEAIEVGGEVDCAIDFDRRFDFMQQHSGEHMVSGLIHERFGCDNVGFHMGKDTVTIDFNCAISEEALREIEIKANALIWENRPVHIFWPDAEALSTLPYRSKKELRGEVRIVEFPGTDICACCGTHVRSTGEIGLIKLLSVHPFREGVRIEMLSGKRAYDYVTTAADQCRSIGAMVSAKFGTADKAVKRLQEELVDVNYRLTAMENRVFEVMAQEYEGAEKALVFESRLSSDGVRRLADALMQRCSGVCAVFSDNGDGSLKYAIGQKDGDLRTLVKEMNAALSGRGGGKPFFAQGSVNCSEEDIKKFFENR